jgi:hypothetical protein
MVLSESELEIWTHQGSVGLSSSTYDSVRNALNVALNVANGKNFEVYLQGSYKNDTNIRGDSDVDIVIQLNSTFQYDYLSMTEEEKGRFHQVYKKDATYLWNDFRDDVLKSLRNHYDVSSVTEGNKSIKIAGNSSRLNADVLVCLQYRKYQSFNTTENEKYVEGIVFYTKNGNFREISFPKRHYENGLNKNKVTNGFYKPTVRMFKNIRGVLVDRSILQRESVPSYFLECLLYNVPNSAFQGSFQNIFVNAVNWLNQANLTGMVTQCEFSNIFGQSSDNWSEDSARHFIRSLINLWNG